ncbi:MAG: hypothetical protein ACE37F_25225 [Nannocystaceae bacterium]|nr:hypothetical protein [bacterium]
MKIATTNRPFVLGCTRPRPAHPYEPSRSDGDPVSVSMGSRAAWEGTFELRARVRDAIAKGDDGIRRLGDLVSTNREAVLRMPELHEYLEHLRKRGNASAWSRIMGTPRSRGRPRADNVGLVLRVDKCMDDPEVGSVAEAARRLEPVLCLSSRTIRNVYSRYEPLVRKMLAGYASPSGTMTERPYTALFSRAG